jgi:hypothetical protein
MRRDSSIVGRARWAALAVTLMSVVSLFVITSRAHAVVVDVNAMGQPSVSYNSSDQSGYYGVALVPAGPSGAPTGPGWTTGQLATAGVPTVTSSGPCLDPALPADLILNSSGICSHSGSVVHKNETFAITWDPVRRYWATTRNYVEQFLSNVAASSDSLGTSPYNDTTQYTDSSGRAANESAYGGGCIDYGNPGGFTCQFGSSNGTGLGNNYPSTGSCSNTTGQNQWSQDSSGAFGTEVPNDVCLTDGDIQNELTSMISQSGLLGHAKPGYTPVLTLLTPPGVVTCIDQGGKLCSANSNAPARFCSYHGQLNVNGTEVPYVVQPWVASFTTQLGCDEPDIPKISLPVKVDELAKDVGQRLVSPISQAQSAALVNPNLTGWFALNGAEINDNGCYPYGHSLDTASVGSGSYFLQREFNNAGAIESDPNALRCTPWVWLNPAFVVPSAVNPGDVVEFDGSNTASTLMVSRLNYLWDFGDGTGAVGPSVTHTFAKGGNYNVTLTVTDRGGNTQTLTQPITVLGSNGLPVPPSNPPTAGPTNTGVQGALTARMMLLPQALRTILRSGISVRVSSNEPANGIAQVLISRTTAKRLHIKAGRARAVVIGRGTVSQVKDGNVLLHLYLSHSTVLKLKHVKHAALTVRLALVGVGGDHVVIDAAGRY